MFPLVHPEAQHNASLAERDKALFNMFFDDLHDYEAAFGALHELHIAKKRFDTETVGTSHA